LFSIRSSISVSCAHFPSFALAYALIPS
jgi:hypothetical protein